MRFTYLAILLTSVALVSCEKEESTPEQTTPKQVQIPFTGNWQRQFEAGPNNVQTSNYLIYQDSIRYILEGPIGQANYMLFRDTFIIENNRFIGHTSTNQHYLIFVKNHSSDSISIYKQEVDNVAEGLTVEVPDESTTANFGWGLYYKK
ncbi:MAG: hypothetical protein H3C45_07685 [Bacteroidia bacterium]|nr:hypothetical protein [Bacteroidia bacterium]MCC7532521.1 hypothetical protein [Bacteroidia bacterium]MCZ2140595.1 hypothetical protein [Bacteroidia bacterium]